MGLQGACPLATSSNIYVDISSNNTNHIYELTPPPSAKIISLRGGQQSKIAVYDVRNHSSAGIFNIAAKHNVPTNTLNYPSILYANRYIIGMYFMLKNNFIIKFIIFTLKYFSFMYSFM